MPGSWSDFLKLRSGPAPPPSSEAGAVRVYADADGLLRSVQSDGTDAAIGGTFNGGTITNALEIAGTEDVTQLTVSAPADADQDVFVVLADASDTANTYFKIDQHGNLTIASGGSYQEATLTVRDNTSGNEGAVQLDSYLGVTVAPEGSSHTLLQLTPQASHTGRLLSVKNVASTEVLAISVGGYLLIKTHAAPADAALTAGESALWFDQTNGAAKLMVKAKTADGTVVTGSLALAP